MIGRYNLSQKYAKANFSPESYFNSLERLSFKTEAAEWLGEKRTCYYIKLEDLKELLHNKVNSYFNKIVVTRTI
jgi:hypothetical protein